jgi:hypothetical protein
MFSLLLYSFENFVVNIECSKWDEASNKNFPSSCFELPVLFNTNTQSVEHKNQKY